MLDGVTTDDLICFQCSNWEVWKNRGPAGGGHTSEASKATFDRILE